MSCTASAASKRKPRSRARSAQPWSVARGIVRPRETGMPRVDIEGAPRHYRTDIAEFYDLARSQSDAHDNGGMAYVCTGPWAGGISLQSKPILLDWPPP